MLSLLGNQYDSDASSSDEDNNDTTKTTDPTNTTHKPSPAPLATSGEPSCSTPLTTDQTPQQQTKKKKKRKRKFSKPLPLFHSIPTFDDLQDEDVDFLPVKRKATTSQAPTSKPSSNPLLAKLPPPKYEYAIDSTEPVARMTPKQEKPAPAAPLPTADDDEDNTNTLDAILPSLLQSKPQPAPLSEDVSSAKVAREQPNLAEQVAAGPQAQLPSAPQPHLPSAPQFHSNEQYSVRNAPQHHGQQAHHQAPSFGQQKANRRKMEREMQMMLQSGINPDEIHMFNSNVVDISRAQIKSDASQYAASLPQGSSSTDEPKVEATFWNAKEGAFTTTTHITSKSRRKHQINSLAVQAQAMQTELLNRKGHAMKTKAQTHAKYGW